MQTIDKIAVITIIVLSFTISILVWGTNACGTECLFHVKPQVTNFSWQNKAIGREDRAFLLYFNRPIDRDSIENNLVIEPPLEGKISWSGNKLAYTLDAPAPYGEKYRLFLEAGNQQFAGGEAAGEAIKPFFGQFKTRDRAFAYIGSEGNNQGRLILYNWTKQEKTVLTPDNLVVFDFEPYPQGDRILFSAVAKKQQQDISQLKLYSVTTGVNDNSSPAFNPEIQLVLDSKKYQNNKFDLSQDGKTIVVQRINQNNANDFGLWKITEDLVPQPLETEAVGDFLLTPDSQTLAVAQGEGIALLPLNPDAVPLDFLPQFGRVVTFSTDGMAAAMVNYNTENADLRYTKSLYYVNNQGVQKELLNLEGSIIDCQFNPTATHLYCLLTELKFSNNLTLGQADAEYREQPYLAEINLKTGKTIPLLALPEYHDSELSVAPDGLGVLFDQVLTTNTPVTEANPSDSSSTIIKSRLWLLLPPTNESEVHQVEQLPLIGFHPQWLP
ncbi:conserved hypothetical protein [Hyella patelloides LEGE 07179]|uniref:SbsA Ig-like domain-containing protein n=1 Tax=Hyella patelloides LEGE 07179 TaxID=945734 RepID=A0A563VUP2_9CYAN|nr:hypothetical protein [Hyella patelloides]VEP15104.1 conserved hypothetical protein [Hyella patelloides LEGE 07179]